jgi:hypothetical protein
MAAFFVTLRATDFAGADPFIPPSDERRRPLRSPFLCYQPPLPSNRQKDTSLFRDTNRADNEDKTLRYFPHAVHEEVIFLSETAASKREHVRQIATPWSVAEA